MRFLILLVLLALVGCDPPPVAVAPASTSAGPIRSLTLAPVVSLDAGRSTHVAVIASGRVFWAQERGDGQDVVYAPDATGLARPTGLTSRAILNALGAKDDRAGGGAIQSLVAGPAPGAAAGAPPTQLYFYFTGGRGAEPLAALGRFDPETGGITIFSDFRRLQADSALGRSLELARGTLVPAGGTMWLWLHHFDGSAFLRFDPASVLDPRLLTLARPFGQPSGEFGPLRPDEGWAISGLPDESLLLTDRDGRVVWRIDGAGVATLWLGISDLPAGVSPPEVLPPGAGEEKSGGTLLLFAANGPLLASTLIDAGGSRFPTQVVYPALQTTNLKDTYGPPDRFAAVPRDAMVAPAAYPLYAVRLGRLVPDPSNPAVLYAYDEAGGDLLRITLGR